VSPLFEGERGLRCLESHIAVDTIHVTLQNRRAVVDTPTQNRLYSVHQIRHGGSTMQLPAKAPLPSKTAGALRFRNQAQFNPVQYLIALAAAIEADGEFDGTHIITPEGQFVILTRFDPDKP
jgi:hypothetical protein